MPRSKSKKSKFSKKRNRYQQEDFNVPLAQKDSLTLDSELSEDNIFDHSNEFQAGSNSDHKVSNMNLQSAEPSEDTLSNHSSAAQNENVASVESNSQVPEQEGSKIGRQGIQQDQLEYDVDYVIVSDPNQEADIIPEIAATADLDEHNISAEDVEILIEPLTPSTHKMATAYFQNFSASTNSLHDVGSVPLGKKSIVFDVDEHYTSGDDEEIPIEPLTTPTHKMAAAYFTKESARCPNISPSASMSSVHYVDGAPLVSTVTDSTELLPCTTDELSRNFSISTSCSSLSNSYCFNLDDLDSTIINPLDYSNLNTTVQCFRSENCSTPIEQDLESLPKHKCEKRGRARSLVNPVKNEGAIKWPKKSSSGSLLSWLDSATDQSLAPWMEREFNALEEQIVDKSNDKSILEALAKSNLNSNVQFPSSKKITGPEAMGKSDKALNSLTSSKCTVEEEVETLITSRNSSETSDLCSSLIASEDSEITSVVSNIDEEIFTANETQTTPKTSRKCSNPSTTDTQAITIQEEKSKTLKKSSKTTDILSSNANNTMSHKRSRHSSASNPDLGPTPPSPTVIQPKKRSKSVSGLVSLPAKPNVGLVAPTVVEPAVSYDHTTDAQDLTDLTDLAACRFESDSERGDSDVTEPGVSLMGVRSDVSLGYPLHTPTPSYCSDIVPYVEPFHSQPSTEDFLNFWFYFPTNQIVNFFMWIGSKIKQLLFEWWQPNREARQSVCRCCPSCKAASVRIEEKLLKLEELIIALGARPSVSAPNATAAPPPPPPPSPPPPPPPPMMANVLLPSWKSEGKSHQNQLAAIKQSRPSITVEDLQKVSLKKTPSITSLKAKKPQQNGPVVSLEMIRSVKLRPFNHRRISQERLGSRVRKTSRSPRDRAPVPRDRLVRGASRTLLAAANDDIIEQ